MKYLLLFGLLLLQVTSFAQVDTKKPVRWKFDLKKVDATHYTLFAKATIDAGWHVFSPDPGGDGLLIPVSVVLNASQKIEYPEKWTVDSKITTKEMPEVGVVHYLEGEAVLQMTLTTTKLPTVITGTMTSQSCNDHMCLPPVEDVFKFEIKE